MDSESREKSESHQTSIYPTERQYQRWKGRADARSMSVAEWICGMVEAGQKKFGATVEPDEDTAELRQQRNDLKRELRAARERIETLEDELHHGERRIIHDFVRDNPGCDFEDVVRHVTETAPSRIREKLSSLEGDLLRREDGNYYPADKGDGGR